MFFTGLITRDTYERHRPSIGEALEYVLCDFDLLPSDLDL